MDRSQTRTLAPPALALLVATLLGAGLSRAQETPKPAPAASPAPKAPEAQPTPFRRGTRPGDVQKVIAVHYANVGELRGLLSVFPADFSSYRSGSQTMVAVSAAPAVVAAIEETIKRLDVPPPSPQLARSIELTVWVVEARGQKDASASIPADLEGVVAQLKRTFNFESYRLADTLVARARDGSSFETSALGNNFTSAQGRTVSYSLNARRATVVALDSGSNVHLDVLELVAEVPVPNGIKGPDGKFTGWNARRVNVKGDVDVREGQRVVVGKSGIGGDDDGSGLIFVLSAKVVD